MQEGNGVDAQILKFLLILISQFFFPLITDKWLILKLYYYV